MYNLIQPQIQLAIILFQHIEAALGKTIKGQLDKTDSGIIYTDSYVSRYNFCCCSCRSEIIIHGSCVSY